MAMFFASTWRTKMIMWTCVEYSLLMTTSQPTHTQSQERPILQSTIFLDMKKSKTQTTQMPLVRVSTQLIESRFLKARLVGQSMFCGRRRNTTSTSTSRLLIICHGVALRRAISRSFLLRRYPLGRRNTHGRMNRVSLTTMFCM